MAKADADSRDSSASALGEESEALPSSVPPQRSRICDDGPIMENLARLVGPGASEYGVDVSGEIHDGISRA